MNEKIKWIIIGILIILSFFAGLSFNKLFMTGNVVSDLEGDNYSWTKAICNEKHECIDVVIYCNGSKVMKIEPISKLKEFDENWSYSGDYEYCS